MLKKFLLPLILLSPCSALAQSEQKCLASGQLAEMSAKLLQMGETEENVIDSITDPENGNPKRPAARQKAINDNNVSIARYVYTVRPTPAEARKDVYKKCMAGGLGYINWKEQPAAARGPNR